MTVDIDVKTPIFADTTGLSPFTVPHQSVTEMRRYREVMEGIRRAGYVAGIEKVFHRVKLKYRSSRERGGPERTLVRMFLRALQQGKIEFNTGINNNSLIAEMLNNIWDKAGLNKILATKWCEYHIKNAKRAVWEPGIILSKPGLEQLAEVLAISFGADPVKVKNLLFSVERFKDVHSRCIDQVISAIIKAPGMGIEPFRELYDKGLLPDKQKIRDAFKEIISSEQIETCFRRRFVPGSCRSGDAPKLQRIFFHLGIRMVMARKCARVIAPPMPSVGRKHHNPGQKKCAEHFVSALLQSDINSQRIPMKKLVDRLDRYGLTIYRYYKLKKERFSPNCLNNTAENRQQIRQMSKSLNVDAAHMIQVLVER